MTMKHDRDQETDEQRRESDTDVADDKLGLIPGAWQTALGKDDDDEATADEVARGEDLDQGNRDEDRRDP